MCLTTDAGEEELSRWVDSGAVVRLVASGPGTATGSAGTSDGSGVSGTVTGAGASASSPASGSVTSEAAFAVPLITSALVESTSPLAGLAARSVAITPSKVADIEKESLTDGRMYPIFVQIHPDF
jgi:hypothetical protein